LGNDLLLHFTAALKWSNGRRETKREQENPGAPAAPGTRLGAQAKPPRPDEFALGPFPLRSSAAHEPLDGAQAHERSSGARVGMRRQHKVEQLRFGRKLGVLYQGSRDAAEKFSRQTHDRGVGPEPKAVSERGSSRPPSSEDGSFKRQ